MRKEAKNHKFFLLNAYFPSPTRAVIFLPDIVTNIWYLKANRKTQKPKLGGGVSVEVFAKMETLGKGGG